MLLLNVGAGASTDVPPQFAGWEMVRLDIDPAVKPDICCDALDLGTATPDTYDGVFASHNVEHFYRHDVPRLLAGFLRVLKPGGVVYVMVPDMGELLAKAKELDDVWYEAPCGPITYHDVMYGWSGAMERGNLFYAHKCGFTEKSLAATLKGAGFVNVSVQSDHLNLHGLGYKCR